MAYGRLLRLLGFLGLIVVSIVSAPCIFDIHESCDSYNKPPWEGSSMVIDDICYVYGLEWGDDLLSIYRICDARKSVATPNAFTYGRNAVFKTPHIYMQFMSMLRASGRMMQDSAYDVGFGAINDGRSAGNTLSGYMWLSNASTSMCYIFNDDGMTSPPGASVSATNGVIPDDPRPPPGAVPTNYYGLFANPCGEFNFLGFTTDELHSSPYICEFGCGTAPTYASTPEWHNILLSLMNTTTSPACFSSTTSTPASSSSSSTIASTDATGPPLSPSTTTLTTPTITSSRSASSTSSSSGTPSTCDSTLIFNTMRQCPTNGFYRLYPNNALFYYGYRPVGPDVASLIEIDNTCEAYCTECDSRLYGRSATFRDKEIFDAAVNLVKAMPPSERSLPVIIGAAGLPTAKFVSDFSWTAIRTNQPDSQSQIMTETTYPVTTEPRPSYQALAFYSQTPYNFTSHDADSLQGLPFICECGCAPYVQIGNTSPGWDLSTSSVSTSTASSVFVSTLESDSPETTMENPTTLPSTSMGSSPTSTASTSASASSFAGSAETTIAPSCDVSTLNQAMARGLNNSANAYGMVYDDGITIPIWYAFQDNFVNELDLVAVDYACESFCTSFDSRLYGRSAVFRTKAAHEQLTSTPNWPYRWIITIGAVGGNGDSTAATLRDYKWSNRFTNLGAREITTQTTYSVFQDWGSSSLALSFITQAPYEFESSDVTDFRNFYVCECGCGPYIEDVTSTAIDWDLPTTLKQTTSTATRSTTSSSPSSSSTSSNSSSSASSSIASSSISSMTSTSATTTESQTSASVSPSTAQAASSTVHSSSSIMPMSSSSSSNIASSANCASTYDLTASCILDPPPVEMPTLVGLPQDCADLCSSKGWCRSFNFRLGDATCSQNKCELFSMVSTEIDPLGLSSSSSECVHYDSL